MSSTTFKLIGRVIDSTTTSGLHGLKVEAWDADLIFDDLLGTSWTDANGNFSFVFEYDYFQELFGDLN